MRTYTPLGSATVKWSQKSTLILNKYKITAPKLLSLTKHLANRSHIEFFPKLHLKYFIHSFLANRRQEFAGALTFFPLNFRPDQLYENFRDVVSILLFRQPFRLLPLFQEYKLGILLLKYLRRILMPGNVLFFLQFSIFLHDIQSFYLGLYFQLESLENIVDVILNQLMLISLEAGECESFNGFCKIRLRPSKKFPIQNIHKIVLMLKIGQQVRVWLLYVSWCLFVWD